jgi:hypothetical protein
MQITLSKKQWKEIGIKSKWMKKAMSVPMPNQEELKMMNEEGHTVIPHIPRAKHSNETTPNLGKRELTEIIQEFEIDGIDIKTVVQLPTIAKFNENMLVEIDGEQYYIVHIIPDTKKIPGSIIAIDAIENKLTTFPMEGTVDKIRPPAHIKQSIVENINQEIDKYNKKVEEIQKYAGMSKINLQIMSNEKHIDERLSNLQEMIKHFESKQNSPSQSKGYEAWQNRLMQEIKDGKMSDVDAFHTIIFKYQKTPQKLIDDLNSGSLQVPESIKQPLLKLFQKELENKSKAEQEKLQKSIEKSERMEETWEDIQGVEESPLSKIDESHIPGGHYTRLPSYSDFNAIQQQNYQILKSLNENVSDLNTVKNSLSNLRMYVADLDKGQRGKDFLSSPEGQTVIENVKLNLNDIKRFTKKYEIELFKDNKINPKLMGTGGKSSGNALLAVSLNGLINTLFNTINPFATKEIPSETEPYSEPMTTDPVLANNITTLGKEGMAFELTHQLKQKLNKIK